MKAIIQGVSRLKEQHQYFATPRTLGERGQDLERNWDIVLRLYANVIEIISELNISTIR